MWGYSHTCANPLCARRDRRTPINRAYNNFLQGFQTVKQLGDPTAISMLLATLDRIFIYPIPTQLPSQRGIFVEYWSDEANIHFDTFCSSHCLTQIIDARRERGRYASVDSAGCIKVLETAIQIALHTYSFQNSEITPMLRNGHAEDVQRQPNHLNAEKSLQQVVTHPNSFRECWADTRCSAIFTRTHQIPNYGIILAVVIILGLIAVLILQRYFEIFGSAAAACPTAAPCPTLPPPSAPFNTTAPIPFALTLPGQDCQTTAKLADYLTQYLTTWSFPTMSVADMITAVASNFPANITNFMVDWKILAQCKWDAELQYLMNLPTPSTVTLQRIIDLLRRQR
jgi:hypothetical protein